MQVANNVQQAAPQDGAFTWDKPYSPVSTAGVLFQSHLAWLPLPPMSVQEKGKIMMSISQTAGLSTWAHHCNTAISQAYTKLFEYQQSVLLTNTKNKKGGNYQFGCC